MLAVSDVLELLAVELIGIVPDDQAVLVSTNRGAPIALEPKSKTGQAFRDVARRLTGEDVPFTSANGRGNFLSKLMGKRSNA
jgi:septum site-determining protein MinD